MAFNNNKGEFELPYEIKFVDTETNDQLLKDFTGNYIRSIVLCVRSVLISVKFDVLDVELILHLQTHRRLIV